jgi:AcrR family transcriptional regulator
LDAAERVIVEEGLRALSVPRVAAAAGIAPATAYLYFDGRERLIAALQRRYGEDLAARASVLEGPGDRLVRYERFVAASLAQLRAAQGLMSALVREAGCDPLVLLAPATEVMARFIDEGRRAGEFQVFDTHAAALLLTHGTHAVLLDALGSDVPVPRIVATCSALARRLLT